MMTMPTVDSQWYKRIWSLAMKDETWVEQTEAEVKFIIAALQLKGQERILDLACGFGRHALALARLGYSVVGVDIMPVYVAEGRRLAQEMQQAVEFICADIRDITFANEFDVVLNLGDGAIGYLEDDAENLKIFERIAQALKVGGKNLMSIPSAAYARKNFPRRFWNIGNHSIMLAEFDWDESKRRNLYTGHTFKFGEILTKPESSNPISSTRLYTLEELKTILQTHHLEIQHTYGGYNLDFPLSENAFTQVICSQKRDI
jgi:SAM-dependent methyltransferase